MKAKEESQSLDDQVRSCEWLESSYPHLWRAYIEGYVTAERVLEKIEEIKREASNADNVIELSFSDQNDSLFYVIKDGKELMAFDRNENIGDIFYRVKSLLTSLGFEVLG